MLIINKDVFFKSRSTIIIWSVCFVAIIVWYAFVYDWGPKGILHLKNTHPELMLARLDAGNDKPNPDSVVRIRVLLEKLAAQSHEDIDTVAASTKFGKEFIFKLYGKHRSSIYILQMVDEFGKNTNKDGKIAVSQVQYFGKLKIVLALEGLRDKFGS